MTTANHVAGQAVQQAVAHGSQNGSSVWIVWVALAMLALTVCAGYYYQTIHLVAVAAKKRSQRSLKEQTAIKKDDTQLSTFFRNFFVFVIWVHVWHFLLFLLDFQRGRGLSRLGFTEEEVGHQESRMLAFAWHFAVLLPVIVTLLVSYYLNVGREELYLFTCVAVATVSLEVCIGVLIKKSEYIRLLSHQTSLARQRFRNDDLARWLLFFQVLHRHARQGVAKAAFVTGVSLVLFSSIVVLETLRMQQAEGMSTDEIASVLEKHADSSFSDESPSHVEPPETPVETDLQPTESLEAVTIVKPPSKYSLSRGSESCGYEVNGAAKAVKEAEETNRKKRFSNEKIWMSLLCAVTMFCLASRKLWIESEHEDDWNPLDLYATPADALVAIHKSDVYKSHFEPDELTLVCSLIQPTDDRPQEDRYY